MTAMKEARVKEGKMIEEKQSEPQKDPCGIAGRMGEVSGMTLSTTLNKRNVLFLMLSGVVLGAICFPLRDLLVSSANKEYYSHITLIPFISAFLLFKERRRIFSHPTYTLTWGPLLMGIGAISFAVAENDMIALSSNDLTSLMISSAILFWVGGMILLYGLSAVHRAIFPVLFLAFMVPIPGHLLEQAIYFLQVGSTEASYLILRGAGVPVFREGFVFHLPGMSVEVAKECSGIRSSIALLILGVLVAHLFLKAPGKRIVLLLSIVPMAILKNAIRIATLSLLGVYVDERFITQSFLHHSGGFLFFIPSLILMGLVLWLLKRSEADPQRVRRKG
jgi:exosortase